MIPAFEDYSKNIFRNKSLQAASLGNDWFVKSLVGGKNEKVEFVPKTLISLKDQIWVKLNILVAMLKMNYHSRFI